MDKLALFDIDKTLIKSSTGHKAAFSVAFEKVYGIDTNIDVIQPSGMTDQQIIFEVLRLSDLDDEKIKSKLDLCMETMVSAFKENYEDDNIIILGGVLELLSALEKNNVLLGLVTGNLEPIGRGKMEKLNLNHYFNVGGFGNEHISRTELVKIAIKKAQSNFDFIFSGNVFLFGDTPRDIIAGKEAGVIPIGVATGIYSKKQLENAGAAIILDDLTNTDDILKHILN
jgi:phosphoglycolate phosphatase